MAKPKCAECGDPLTLEEIERPSDYGDGPVCCSCETNNHQWRCEFCENYESEEYVAEVFAVFDDKVGVPEGMYYILERPFYSQGLIGGADIFKERIQWLAEVPRNQSQGWAPCAMICQECAKPFLAIVESRKLENVGGDGI